MEVVVFEWEGRREVEFMEAKKYGVWSDMKEREEQIREAVEKAKEIRELAERADEFGVLEILTTVSYYSSVEGFRVVGLILSNAKLTFLLHMNEKEDRGEVEREIKERAFELIDEFIERLEEEAEKQKEYMQEAEKFLTVRVY